MSKIAGLYSNYLRERAEEFKDFRTGGEKMETFLKFLKDKLDTKDYLAAEQMLNELISETNEDGFNAGCKYITALNKELNSN